jgi:ABC-type polysaccharide/polyol phosphate export permease
MNKRIKRFWDLSFYLAKSGFKLRNEGSYLGIIWYLLNPILFFCLLFVVFSQSLGSEIENYAIYLFIGIIMFNYFQSITLESTELIKNNRGLFKSINFSKSAFIFGNTLKFLFSHLLEFLVLILFALLIKEDISNILIYPIILIFFTLFTLGISLLLSSICIFFVDIKNIWIFLSKLIWFGTPIFYKISKGTLIYKVNLLNPLYYFIEITREIIIYNRFPSLQSIILSIFFSISTLILGLIIFEKLKYHIMERI